MDKVYHAAKYIRSSCAANEELQNNTIEHQSLIIDRFLLEYPDIVAVSERIDENISGVTFERPAFKKMVADIIIGKAHTIDIEHDNSNTRHHLGRFTRRTKVVSQLEHTVDITMRIWHAVTTTDLFSILQNVTLSIY